jgi:hypothetical protein
MNERDQLVVWLTIFSLRPNEIFAIRDTAVGPDSFHIENALSQQRELKGTKTDKGKYIALGEALAKKTHQWIAANGIGRQYFLFTTIIGTPMSDSNFLKKHLRPAAKRAKIATLDVDFQILRRSFAALASALGFDVKNIQAQMGHARPDMSLIEYVQPVDDVRRRQTQHLEDVLLGKTAMPVDLTTGCRFIEPAFRLITISSGPLGPHATLATAAASFSVAALAGLPGELLFLLKRSQRLGDRVEAPQGEAEGGTECSGPGDSGAGASTARDYGSACTRIGGAGAQGAQGPVRPADCGAGGGGGSDAGDGERGV